MRLFLLVLLCAVPLLSCSNADDLPVIAACEVNNPARELDWLQQEIANRKANPTENSKYCYIVQAKVAEQTVFLFEDCNPVINKVIPIIDCTGVSVGLLGDENYAVETVVMGEIIYRPSDFKCTF